MTDFSNLPTIFHITHWKAGSQWVYAIMRAVAGDRVIAPKVKMAHFLEDAIIPGMIYPTVYVNRQRFESIPVPENHIKFVVIRDLRDSCVSRYFSTKVSHPVISKWVAQHREELTNLDFEEGFLHVIRKLMPATAEIQLSWLSSGVPIVRYEDLIADEFTQFKRIIEHCQIKIRDKELREIVKANSFESLSGRKKGDEEIHSHFRKGISGDWQNYFSDKIKAEFKERYGEVLIQTGYETDTNW